MAAEDVLPKELDKLEITHIMPHIKLLDTNLPVQLNPFFESDLKDTSSLSNVEQTTDGPVKKPPLSLNSSRTANQICRQCRSHRASEKFRKGISSTGSPGKHKILLREPVLKALQTCLHPHNIHPRKILAESTISSEGPMATRKGMCDFRDLIDECRNLLSEDVDFSGRLNKLSLSNRNSKNFTTIQTPKTQSNNKSFKNRRPILNTATLPSPETAILNADQQDICVLSSLQSPLLGCNISSTNLQQRNTSNLSSEQVSNTARCNTTCSQQAGNSSAAAVCDDVTIDELASYFDTFVHIPKKMSSMAEMMYI